MNHLIKARTAAPTRLSGARWAPQRHHRLVHEAIGMVAHVDGPEELAGNLAFIRDTQFAKPVTVPDREVERVAAWAWGKRRATSIFAGRTSRSVNQLKRIPWDTALGSNPDFGA